MLTKETPFITKGAFALFYGEPTAVSQLPKTKEFLMTILLLFSLVFNVAVMVFKKFRFRSGSRQNNLNELIVGNFLNLMSFTKILLIVCVFLLFSVLHVFAGWNNGSENGTRYMTMKALMETMFQLYHFQSNPAFR